MSDDGKKTETTHNQRLRASAMSIIRAAWEARSLIMLIACAAALIASLIWLGSAVGVELKDALSVKLTDITVGHVAGLILFVWLLFGRSQG